MTRLPFPMTCRVVASMHFLAMSLSTKKIEGWREKESSKHAHTFPQPGGPQKMSDGTFPDSSMVRSMAFFPITLS